MSSNKFDTEWEVFHEESKPIDNLHLILILDESGSMGAIRNDIIGSVNTMIEDQQNLKKDNTTFTFIRFNTNFTVEYDKLPLDKIKLLTSDNYRPSGGTALYDAIGYGINKYSNDENVCMFIVTDGEENSSKEFTHEKISSFIEKKKKKNWNFIYLSSDLSTAKQGANLGIGSNSLQTRECNTNNIATNYNTLSYDIRDTCNNAIKEIRTKGIMRGYGAGNIAEKSIFKKPYTFPYSSQDIQSNFGIGQNFNKGMAFDNFFPIKKL
jgi:hypothetical protein